MLKYTNQIANQNFVLVNAKKIIFFLSVLRVVFFSTLLSFFVCCNTYSIHVVLLWSYAKRFVYIKRIDFSYDSAELLCDTHQWCCYFSASSLLSLWLWFFFFFCEDIYYGVLQSKLSNRCWIDSALLHTYRTYLCRKKMMTFDHVFHSFIWNIQIWFTRSLFDALKFHKFWFIHRGDNEFFFSQIFHSFLINELNEWNIFHW